MIGWAQCVEHRGRHGVLPDGACFIPARERPRRLRWRFVTCERCGADLDVRTDAVTGKSETLMAGTDTPHRHEPPLTVRLDADELADAIVRASRAAREDRRPAGQSSVQGPKPPVPTANGTSSVLDSYEE